MEEFIDTFKRTKQLLAVLPPHDRYKPYYWSVEIAYAYIAGYDMPNRWVNSTNCVDAYTNTTFREKPAYYESLALYPKGSFEKWEARGNFYANQS